MQANVASEGPQRIVLKGYLVRRNNNGTYVAPLIPQLFYGWDGSQLSSWRQDIGATGSQTIISRAAGGYPEVPREELYWRKVSDYEEKVTPTPTVVPTRVALEVPSWVLPLAIGIGATALVVYLWRR